MFKEMMKIIVPKANKIEKLQRQVDQEILSEYVTRGFFDYYDIVSKRIKIKIIYF